MTDQERMAKRKTQKIMDVCIRGFHVEVIQKLNTDDPKPLRVYMIRNGRKQIAKFSCLVHVLAYLHDILKSGAWRTL